VKDVDAERMAASHSLRVKQAMGKNRIARIRLATGFAGQSQPIAEVSCCHGSPRLRPRRPRPFFLPIRDHRDPSISDPGLSSPSHRRDQPSPGQHLHALRA
jgi:hypothetical protein